MPTAAFWSWRASARRRRWRERIVKEGVSGALQPRRIPGAARGYWRYDSCSTAATRVGGRASFTRPPTAAWGGLAAGVRSRGFDALDVGEVLGVRGALDVAERILLVLLGDGAE